MKALLLLSLMAAATDPAFDEAERLATTGDVQAAIAAYADLLAAGHDTRGVRYNLGTLHLERGEVGPAMLHLTAAARFGHDDDVQHNLEVVRRVRRDRVEGRVAASLYARLGQAVSPAQASLGFLAAFALFVALLAHGVARRQRLVAALALVPLLVGGALLGARVAHDLRAHAVVLEPAEARVAPDDQARATFTAHPGLAGVVRARENGYLRLRLDNGLDAWLPAAALGELPPLLR